MNSALQSGSLPHRSPATGHGPLTPVFATLTDSSSPNSFICHLYENNRGVYQLFPKWNMPALPERNSLALPSVFCLLLLPSTLPLATIFPCLHPISLRIANFSPPPPIPAHVSTASSPPNAPSSAAPV